MSWRAHRNPTRYCILAYNTVYYYWQKAYYKTSFDQFFLLFSAFSAVGGSSETVANGQSGPNKGLEKQQSMKTEQEQKELGKGSEKGQQAREEHGKKWWKFW